MVITGLEVCQTFFNKSEQQQNAQVVALGANLARKLFASNNPLGKEIEINNVSFQVIGLMAVKGSFAGENPDDATYVPITTMADQLTGSRSPNGIPVNYIQVWAKNKQSIRAAAFQITNIQNTALVRKILQSIPISLLWSLLIKLQGCSA